jgi:cyclase
MTTLLRPRIIPVLTLQRRALVKTTQFAKPLYLGDPLNALRIFNAKEVDELVILDITATPERRRPDLGLIRDLAGECFMPISYGGGIVDVATVEQVLKAGVEKVVVNAALFDHPAMVTEAARAFGSQAVVASIDVTRSRLGRYRVRRAGPRARHTDVEPGPWARTAEQLGAGEILLTSVDREGTGSGYDLALVSTVARAVQVPVVALGGAAGLHDLGAVLGAGAAGAAASRLFVCHGRHRAALVSYPTPDQVVGLVPAGRL